MFKLPVTPYVASNIWQSQDLEICLIVRLLMHVHCLGLSPTYLVTTLPFLMLCALRIITPVLCIMALIKTILSVITSIILDHSAGFVSRYGFWADVPEVGDSLATPLCGH
jgi:hypothetical protein